MLTVQQDRRRPFTLMGREWFHAVLLKRGGRFLKAGGVGSTQQGELAIQCRLCPIPGKNCPADLSSIPADKL
jgi:hypothetical protein